MTLPLCLWLMSLRMSLIMTVWRNRLIFYFVRRTFRLFKTYPLNKIKTVGMQCQLQNLRSFLKHPKKCAKYFFLWDRKTFLYWVFNILQSSDWTESADYCVGDTLRDDMSISRCIDSLVVTVHSLKPVNNAKIAENYGTCSTWS